MVYSIYTSPNKLCQVKNSEKSKKTGSSFNSVRRFTGPEGWEDEFGSSLSQTHLPDKTRKRLPAGHRFFPDALRETTARLIEWLITRKGKDSWFATLTFHYFVSEYKADKLKKCWVARMAEALRNSGGSELTWVSATEWQKREVIHFHLIITGRNLGVLSRKRWEHRWQVISGGFARIYDARRKAAPYLAKYCNKSRGGEIQWGGAWRGLYVPASVSRHNLMSRKAHLLSS